MRSIEKSLVRLLKLQTKKWHLTYKLYYKKANLFEFKNYLGKVKRIILKEIDLTNKVENVSRKIVERVEHYGLKNLLHELIMLCHKMHTILVHEYEHLVAVNLAKTRKDKDVLAKHAKMFYGMFVEENKLGKEFTQIISKHKRSLAIIKGFSKKKRELAKVKVLLKQLQNALSELVKARNIKEAALANKKVSNIITYLQRTDAYEFMKSDIDLIKSFANRIMKNPKENKIKFVFTSIYLIAPFTFEVTGVVLALRFATKYAIKRKVKQFKVKMKK